MAGCQLPLHKYIYGPKFCVRKFKLTEEDFDVEMEECIAKIKWDWVETALITCNN